MGELLLSSPFTATVANTGDVDEATWAGLVDALSHVASATGVSHLDLPLVSVAQWLWYFTTSGAGQWKWEDRLLEHLKRQLNDSFDVEVVLSMDPLEQCVWPSIVPIEALGLARSLTDVQRRNIARMIRLGGGANFSVPGAGKTTMAYVTWAALHELGHVGRLLVVAPISAHESWDTEAQLVFATPVPSVAIRPRRAGREEICVVNYERLESPDYLDHLISWCQSNRALVVFDEAHRAKRGESGVRGAAALRLSKAARRTMALTGTPRPNAASDLAAVMELAFPGRGTLLAASSPSALRRAFCRVTKDELGLPPYDLRTERVPMSVAHERVYEAMLSTAARAIIEDPSIADDLQRAGRIALLLLQAATDPTAVLSVKGPLNMTNDRADAGLEDLIRELPSSFVPTKFVRVMQLVEQHRQQGTKVLVWASFRHHIERLRTLLSPFEPAVVDGSIPLLNARAATDRTREITRFRTDPNCTVLIATPHTLAEGVSLHQTTTHQIHLDRTFNAGMLLQSLDRTHRLGLPADASCTATYLISTQRNDQDTIDAFVASRLEEKMAAMAIVLNDPSLRPLALPDTDELLSDDDVFLGPDRASDLRALFAHLKRQV